MLDEGELSTPREIQARVLLQGINDAAQTPGTFLGLFAVDTYIYTTHCKEGYMAKSAAWSSVLLWYEHWNIKISEVKTQAICLPRGNRLAVSSCVERMEHSFH